MPKRKTAKPETLRKFKAAFPDVWKQYESLRAACDRSGPLSPKTRELIKIGIEVSRKRHGGLVAHIKKARAAGASATEINQAILLTATLVGIPEVLDAFSVLWRQKSASRIFDR